MSAAIPAAPARRRKRGALPVGNHGNRPRAAMAAVPMATPGRAGPGMQQGRERCGHSTRVATEDSFPPSDSSQLCCRPGVWGGADRRMLLVSCANCSVQSLIYTNKSSLTRVPEERNLHLAPSSSSAVLESGGEQTRGCCWCPVHNHFAKSLIYINKSNLTNVPEERNASGRGRSNLATSGRSGKLAQIFFIHFIFFSFIHCDKM